MIICLFVKTVTNDTYDKPEDKKKVDITANETNDSECSN